MRRSPSRAKIEGRSPIPVSETSAKETEWLDGQGAARILKITQQQLKILRFTLQQPDRFALAELARTLNLRRQDFSVCIKLLQERGLVRVRRVTTGKQRPFVAEPGAVLKAAAEVSLD